MADVNIAVVITKPDAIAAVFTPAGAFTAPVPPKTNIGSLKITPNGAVTLSGADAADFALTAPSQGVASLTNTVQLNAGTYHLVMTVTPAGGAMQAFAAAGGHETLPGAGKFQKLTAAGGFRKF